MLIFMVGKPKLSKAKQVWTPRGVQTLLGPKDWSPARRAIVKGMFTEELAIADSFRTRDVETMTDLLRLLPNSEGLAGGLYDVKQWLEPYLNEPM